MINTKWLILDGITLKWIKYCKKEKIQFRNFIFFSWKREEYNDIIIIIKLILSVKINLSTNGTLAPKLKRTLSTNGTFVP